MKRTSKSFRFVVALLLMFTLSFPMGFNAYAETGGSDGAAPTPSTTFELNTGDTGNPESQNQDSDETSEPAITSEGASESDSPADTSPEEITKTDEAITTTDEAITTTGEAVIATEEAITAEAIELLPFASQDLTIESVQVVNGGAVQTEYRDTVTLGEDGKYYTSMRSASMTDARIFRVHVTVSYTAIGITDFADFNKDNLVWTYGGKALSEWKKVKNNTFSGDQAITVDPATVHITDDAANQLITITADVLFDAFYPANTSSVNVPYPGYTSTTKGGFPILQRDDGTSPLGTHALSLSYNVENQPVELGSTDIKLNLYDSFHTWQEIDAIARQLQEDSKANHHIINGRYLSAQSIGQSQSGRDIWNVIIAKDAQSVVDYLNITKPMMESVNGINELNRQLDQENALLSGYHKMPIYFNNVHPDETPGSDAILDLIDKFIYEDTLSYRTQTDSTHHDFILPEDPEDNLIPGYTIEGENNETELVTFNIDDLLDQFILVFNITENPDGKDNLVRTNDYGFDLNRDAAYQTQRESTALTTDLVKWQPVSMLEYHGYVERLLIEPCTGPHDPNYEYDLYADKMFAQGSALGRAMIGNTGYHQYLVPAVDYPDGWDDGAPVYGPMFAMLYGTMGYTLEIPHSTEDAMDACITAGLALAKDCLDNRNNYFRNKLIYKQRCILNEDNPIVDTYLIDPYTGEQVGRPRTEGHSFFPEYYVIPVDEAGQSNPLEAYKALESLKRNGVHLSVTKDQVSYGRNVFPAGTFVIDMHQGSRGFINSMLSDGYDASGFKDIYAEIVINYPEMRNFDCLTVWDEGVFNGKTDSVNRVDVPETEISGSDLVVIKNDNIDVIRLVNRLLNEDKTVQILTEEFGNAKKGDFVIARSDLDSIDYSDLLVYDVEIEGTPTDMEPVVEPNMAILGSSAHSRYILDLLEFTGDYTFASSASSIPADTNVIVGFDNNTNVAANVNGGTGYIGIGNRALSFAKNSGLLPGFDYARPGASYNEGLVEATYADDNLITANYDDTDAAYIMNGTFITGIPSNGEALITVDDDDDFFIAGWYPDHDVLKGKTLAISGYAGADQDVPVTLFANNIFSKAHAQQTFNMFANAVFLTASDIAPSGGQANPDIAATPASQETAAAAVKVTIAFDPGSDDVTLTSSKYKVTSSATEPGYTGEDTSWLDYVSGSSITLGTTGTYYIHAYAMNSDGASVQKTFGPYHIVTSGGGGHHDHGGGGSSTAPTPPTTTAPAVAAPLFTDIAGHWAQSSIEYVVGKGLYSGVSDTLFAPDATMTRGMLITVLGRAFGLNTDIYSQKSVPSDVPPSAYYAPYAAWAYENKIASGSGDGLFAPDEPVTRGEMAVIITNYMKFIGKDTAGTAALNYADAADIPGWGLEGVRFVTANGLMTGIMGNSFDFDGLSTRAQVATVMERLLKLMEQ